MNITEDAPRGETTAPLTESLPELAALTPRRIVAELDRYIIGQREAKRAVAVALRNRWRRQLVAAPMQAEISPKNILMCGPTGVGKTEIARRLANLAGAPFLKIEATKYTEVGYVGRDVESMIRDLVELALAQVKRQEAAKVEETAARRAEERLLDALLPDPRRAGFDRHADFLAGPSGPAEPVAPESRTRDKLRALLAEGALEAREIELELRDTGAGGAVIEVPGMEAIDLRSMVRGMMPERTRRRRLSVRECRPLLLKEETENLIDMERIVPAALKLVETAGIVFIDELDKIIAPESRGSGPDVSREGVQRDLLPIVEGTTVMTKHGSVRTDHILFIAAGAFSSTKPADLIPELQGRFPIRVELDALGEAELRRILVEPRNALVAQYTALLATDGLVLEFGEDAIDELAAVAHQVNSRSENIGARRLHTVMERLLEDVLFDAPESGGPGLRVDRAFVKGRLAALAADEDLSKFIL